jgi:hypothetical protein
MTSAIEQIGDRAEPALEVAVEGSGGQESLAPGATEALWVEAREYIWLDDFRNGTSTKAIALREGVTARRIRLGVLRARDRERASYLRDSRNGEFLRKRDRGRSPVSWGSAARSAGRWESRYPPRLVPFFPIGPFTPQSRCSHRGPIRPGSRFCCMVCSRSGVDDHQALKRDPRTDPRPEPKVAPPASPAPGRETRKERRRRLFAALHAGPRPAVAV